MKERVLFFHVERTVWVGGTQEIREGAGISLRNGNLFYVTETMAQVEKLISEAAFEQK